MTVPVDDEHEGHVPHPDGGYGWVVVFASFMMHGIAGGAAYAFGIFIPYIEKDPKIGAQPSATNVIGSMMLGVLFAIGPVAGALVNRFGCRSVAVLGALIGAAGFSLSYLAPNVYVLIVTVGVLGGAGLGLTYLPSVVIVSQWFEKKRALATAMVVCAEGFGHFGSSYLFKFTVNSKDIGWQKSMIILGSLLLLCVIFALLYRPVPLPAEIKSLQKGEKKEEAVALDASSQHTLPATEEPEGGGGTTEGEASSSDAAVNQGETAQPSMEDAKERSSLQSASTVKKGVIAAKSKAVQGDGRKSQDDFMELEVIPVTHFVIAEELHDREYKLHHKLCILLHSFLDFHLLHDPLFVYFSIINLMNSFGNNTISVLLASLAEYNIKRADPNADPMEELVVGAFGIAGSASRLTLGYVSDKPCVNRIYLFAAGIILNGITIGCMTLPHTVPPMVVASAISGILYSFDITLTPVVLGDLVGVARLNSAFGLILFFQGVGSLLGPPFVGIMEEQTGNNYLGYIIVGSVTGLSGVMMALIPSMLKRRSKKRIGAMN